MSVTSIEWTDATWNPTRGCSRVSEGCRNCYAERIAARFSKGRVDKPKRQGEFQGFAIMKDDGPHWTGKVELIESKLTEPLNWRKPRRVFVNSMSDLFHEALPDEAIDRVFAVMALSPGMTFQVLTKRAKRMAEFVANWVQRSTFDLHLSNTDHSKRYTGVPHVPGWPIPNVWLGVSCEDQDTADDRIPKLLQTPAEVRFVSYEPTLEPVDFRPWLTCLTCAEGRSRHPFQCNEQKLDWIIVGGESGPGARPFDVEWARETIRQCKTAGVPCFVKQLGSNPVHFGDHAEWWADMRDSKGGNWDEWPEDLRVREFPGGLK